MAKYVCSICGYVYDEAKGITESGIARGTGWDSIPEDWVCPLCGASKAEFYKQGESDADVVKKPMPVVENFDDMKELSALEISAICSNLARGCEKQYKAEEAALFTELAEYFKATSAPCKEPSTDKLIDLIEKDLKDNLPNARAISTEAKDRGALRALTWSEKVTRILNSLLSRYQKEGEAMLENTGVFVCTICGFIYIGDTPPDLCPICKVQSWKFDKVEGGN